METPCEGSLAFFWPKEDVGMQATSIRIDHLPLGQQLRLRRVAAGLTQGRLAHLAGISQPLVCQVEQNYSTLTPTTREHSVAVIDAALRNVGH